MTWLTHGACLVVGVVVGFFVASRLFYAMQQDFFRAFSANHEDK